MFTLAVFTQGTECSLQLFNVFCCNISGNKINMRGHVLGLFSVSTSRWLWFMVAL